MPDAADAQLDNALSVSTLLRGHEQQLAAKEAAKQKAEDDRLKRQDDELRRQDAAQVRTDSAAARAEKIRVAKMEQLVIQKLEEPGSADSPPPRSPQRVKNIIAQMPGSEGIIERHLRGGIAAQNAAIDVQKNMLEAITNDLAPVLSIKDPVAQQAEWERLVQRAVESGVIQNAAAVPAKVDRGWIIRTLESFEGSKAHLDALKKELADEEKKKNPSVDDLDKWSARIATEMGHAKTPEDWARGRDALLKLPNFPESLRAAIDVPFSSVTAENFLTKGLSPNEYFAHKDREAAERAAAARAARGDRTPRGRGVTSGDVGRLTEFDAALDDATVIDEMLRDNPGGTGWIPGKLVQAPGALTALTGLGEEEKARQATIDRVKQAIGKTLEGGVLRKEDEYKYAKILPTMEDQPEVALQKMAGLRRALEGKRSDFMANLEDAGYDLTRFRERDEQRKAAAAADVEARRKNKAGEVNPSDEPPEAVKRHLRRAPVTNPPQVRGDGTRGWVMTGPDTFRRVK
jgi:hypothetical protein